MMTIDYELSRMISDIAREFHSQSLRELPLFLEARKISTLFHFTSLQNLSSIFEHGILGIEDLRSKAIDFKASDHGRQDPILNGICVSLTRPNDYMLSNKLTQGHQLALLELSPASSILRDLCFIASPGNFGRRDHKTRILEWPEKYCGGTGLANLFLNRELRKRYNLDSSQPTDPQAEIVFLDSIPASFISRIFLPAGKEYADIESVRSLIQTLPKGVLVESQNARSFPQIVWSDPNRTQGFEERKWRIEWESEIAK